MRVLTRRLAALAPIALAAAGCPSSRLAELEGKWKGTITCTEGTSDLTMGLKLEQESLVGTAYVRTAGTNSKYSIKGVEAASCAEDTCRGDLDCLPDTEEEFRECVYASTCLAEVRKKNKVCRVDALVGSDPACDPCKTCDNCLVCKPCSEKWLPLKLSFQDELSQIKDPEAKLWRFGNVRLEGTIEDFCIDQDTQWPRVVVSKEQ